MSGQFRNVLTCSGCWALTIEIAIFCREKVSVLVVECRVPRRYSYPSRHTNVYLFSRPQSEIEAPTHTRTVSQSDGVLGTVGGTASAVTLTGANQMEAAALGGSHLSMWVAALMTCLGSALPFLSFSTIDVEKSSPVQQSAAAIQQDETIKRNEAIVTSALVAPVRLPPPGAVHASEKKKCAKAASVVERILSAEDFFAVLGLPPPAKCSRRSGRSSGGSKGGSKGGNSKGVNGGQGGIGGIGGGIGQRDRVAESTSRESAIEKELLRRSYMYLARRVHPDKCEEEGSKEAFFKLQEAFAVLADPDLRARYAMSLEEDRKAASRAAKAVRRHGGSDAGGADAPGSACASWHSHKRDGSVVRPSDKPRNFVEAAKRARDSRLELERQVREMLAAKARGSPMARSAASRRAAEERAGRERERKERIRQATAQKEEEAKQRREAAERALKMARRKLLLPGERAKQSIDELLLQTQAKMSETATRPTTGIWGR